jgi:hypothetical protein
MSTFSNFLIAAMFGAVFSAQPARASNAPVIAPTRLDFDATQAPKNCNDDTTFRAILANWVPREVLTADAERRLAVRIRRSPTGGKLVDLTVVDTNGTAPMTDHKEFPSKTECYKVLYASAYTAATLLGAFEKPPAPEPLVCPAPLAPAESPRCPACPTHPTRSMAPPRIELPASPTPRVFLGAGVFLGMTTTAEPSVGPYLSLGFRPFARWSDVRIEFDGGWASSNTQAGLRVDRVPLSASLCHAGRGLRLCGGLVTTFAEYSNVDPANAELHVTLASSLRMGTEFNIVGPLSIRLDAFILLPLNQRPAFNATNSFAAGAVVMGVWSFE